MPLSDGFIQRACAAIYCLECAGLKRSEIAAIAGVHVASISYVISDGTHFSFVAVLKLEAACAPATLAAMARLIQKLRRSMDSASVSDAVREKFKSRVEDLVESMNDGLDSHSDSDPMLPAA